MKSQTVHGWVVVGLAGIHWETFDVARSGCLQRECNSPGWNWQGAWCRKYRIGVRCVRATLTLEGRP